jgi:hypothetical protein
MAPGSQRRAIVSRYRFELATESDDAQLRARMREGAMEGNIAISFRREPSYFLGCCLQGDRTEVIKCVDAQTNTIVGLGSRSTSEAYINGEARRIGYLADLRSISAYRSGTLLARGYKFLQQLHDADPVPFYVTVIYEGNEVALRNLVGARAGLPEYREIGRLLTPAIHLDVRRREIALHGLRLVRGSSGQLQQIVRFLNQNLREKQLAPVYRESDFEHGRFRDLRPQDFFLAMDGDEICGTVAAWDQYRMRQTHVERYSHKLATIRPLYNLAARVSPLRALPGIGEAIPYIYLACVAARNNDPEVFRCLLRAAYNELRHGKWHYAIVGLDAADPLVSVLSDYRSIPTAGRVFSVRYPVDGASALHLPGAGFYLEAGCL